MQVNTMGASAVYCARLFNWAMLMAWASITGGPVFAQDPSSSGDTANRITIEINTPGETPPWAMWQRRLLDDLAPAAREFVAKYTRTDGTLIWRKEWPGIQALNPKYPIHLWFASRDKDDYGRIQSLSKPEQWQRLEYRKGKRDSENLLPWLGFLAGKNADYPLQILKATYAEMLKRLQEIRHDQTSVDEQDVHHWQKLNPVVLEALVQLTMGCPNHIYHGGLLHASIRHFDPQNQRPGLPPDVAVLVDHITPIGISLQVVNMHPTESRELIIQGGAFGEHQIKRVKQVIHYPYQFHSVDSKCVSVRLAPGAVGRLELELERYANPPSYAFPWHADTIPLSQDSGR